MNNILAAPLIAALALTIGVPAQAQTTSSTKVTHDTGMNDGMPTSTTKVTHVTKRKTHRPKKIFGVKVGHKTVTHKTVRTTTMGADGDRSMSVKHTN